MSKSLPEQEQPLALFHRAAAEVPAYQKFLRRHRLDPATIQTWDDFTGRVPISSKKNYLQKYPLADLSWGGTLAGPLEFCATSGSTSEPFYFPRSDTLAQQYADILEDFVHHSSRGATGSTLVIIGFGMGIWIGGVITLRGYQIFANRTNHPLSILPAGINKEEIFKGLIRLSPQFDQTIIVGYPPFIKDIVDEAPSRGINLGKLGIRFHFAAESFNERFRDYLCRQAGIKNPALDTMNIYGTADIGAMAYETPLSILIRRLASQDPVLFETVFSQISKTPTLAQFNPKHVNFEEVDGQVVLTGDSTLPLIRYAVGDRGGVISYDKMMKLLAEAGLDTEKELHKAGIEHTVKRLPFVFVYERADFSVSLYGATIYPEFVKDGLVDDLVAPYVTERFNMVTKNDDQERQYLEINLELRRDVAKLDTKTKRLVVNAVIDAMTHKSSEFREIARQLGGRKVTKFVFWPNEHPLYFKPGVKQRWAGLPKLGR